MADQGQPQQQQPAQQPPQQPPQVPQDQQDKTPIPMVWSMKRKRDPIGFVIKWKARLCAGGHKSKEFIDYWQTYSPVVSWNTVRLLIVLALINNWYMQSIDFVLAFPQAPVKTDIYMKPPKVPPNFVIPDLPKPQDRYTSVYKLIQNLYGLKDAGKTWFDFLREGLLQRGWKQSKIDECLFTKNGIGSERKLALCEWMSSTMSVTYSY